MASVYTIGYEQSSLVEFMQRIAASQVELVIDVRAVPLSRKPGFSKTKLAAALVEIGVGYSHLVRLGAPRELRHRLRQGGTWAQYERGYKAHLENCGAEIQALLDLARERTVCLLCFERDPAVCHRRLIAERMLAQHAEIRIEHLRY